MESRTLQFIAEACESELLNCNPAAVVSGVATDSRKVQQGDLFVALKGDKFDAHEFLKDVFSAGASAAVVEKAKVNLLPPGGAAVVVENSKRALGKLATRYAGDFDLTRIAIGGSNGKTSTKELAASILRQGLAATWSQASFNNDIGVPLTLLSIGDEHEAGVFEVGTNHPGELKPLLEMIQPKHGIITSIGREHLEFFHDLDGVLQEEGFLAEALPADGCLLINGDAPEADKLARRTRAKVLRAGLGRQNDWRISGIELAERGTSFSIETAAAKYSGRYQINLLGRHQVLNATYAIAIGSVLGLSPAQIQRGLDQCKPAKMRLEVKQIDQFTVLDDSYNANADSVRAALETLREFPCHGRRIAVLGDMGELGDQTLAAHREIGEFAACCGVNTLLAVGKFSAETAQGARGGGLRNVLEAGTVSSALQQLETLLEPGDVLLVKASRSSRLEQVIDFLSQRFGSPQLADQKA